jgi:hypothetical protein
LMKHLPFVAILYKYVKSWDCDIWTICSVNFNLRKSCKLGLRKSCKLGLRRMCCRCEFIAGMWLSVVEHGGCSETHPEQDFSDFWLEVSLKFSINCFDLSSFFLLREDNSPTAAILALRRF